MLAASAPAVPQHAPKVLPWVEKYRPKTVDDIAHQEEVVATLKGSIKSGNMPHLLMYGPPGTGKTTTALALCRALYGPDLFKARVLELNASDERGIAVIRTKVKTFAQRAIGAPSAATLAGGKHACPPFKVIILDEADSMTKDAQTALRRTMEAYSKVTRFVLICNYVSRIIEPLASRCVKFRFKPLHADPMRAQLLMIAAKERVALAPGCVEAILRVSGGDMRKAITTLQSAQALFVNAATGAVTAKAKAAAAVAAAGDADAEMGEAAAGSSSSSAAAAEGVEGVAAAEIEAVSGVIPESELDAYWAALSAHNFGAVRTAVDELLANGHSALALYGQLLERVLADGAGPAAAEGGEGAAGPPTAALSDAQKARMCRRIAESDKCLADGADEALQVMDVSSYLSQVACKTNTV